MKTLYAFVANERQDTFIRDTIDKLFAHYKGKKAPLDAFRSKLRAKLGYQVIR